MQTYSAYVIGADGKICGVEFIVAPDEDEALRVVQERFTGLLLEVWYEDRLIAQVNKGVIVRI